MLLNAFSMNMLDAFPAVVQIVEISVAQTRTALLLESEEAGDGELVLSAVGHADTAAIFASVLGLPVPMNRQTVVLKKGQCHIVGQYSGPRLAEGASILPMGAAIKWLAVSVA